MALKFGIDQIDNPSPTWLKFIVNLLIVVVFPFISGSMLVAVNYGYLDKNVTSFVAEILVITAGALKAFEKLLGVTNGTNG